MIFNDKIIHILEYFILGVLSFRFFNIVNNKNVTLSNISTFIFCTIFAISDEIHQGFVGYFDSGEFGSVRDPDLFDLFADISGISTSIVILYIYRNLRNPYKTETDVK
ncbi:MAG: VanZ family protein [Candidatus Delongbacteria bacterium]|nr:VanZ family protein [Candidatus Delongbacteria bacterium]